MRRPDVELPEVVPDVVPIEPLVLVFIVPVVEPIVPDVVPIEPPAVVLPLVVPMVPLVVPIVPLVVPIVPVVEPVVVPIVPPVVVCAKAALLKPKVSKAAKRILVVFIISIESVRVRERC